MNMKICGRRYIGKHREIKDSDNYITLGILLKFVSDKKMRITSSDPKYYLGRSGKGLITFMGLKTNVRPKKYKKARYSITNVIMRYFSNIIKEFKRLHYKGYVQERPKHEPTDNYFYLARHLDKCIMRADPLNLRVDPVRTEMTCTLQIPISCVCDSDKRKSKEIIADENVFASLFYGQR